MKKNVIRIIIAVIITLVFAALSRYFTRTDTGWYRSLIKPEIQPPDIAFTVAWGTIYSLFAASFAVMLIKNDGKGALPYLLNLILLVMWCVIFFVQQSAGAGLILLLMIFAAAIYLGIFAYNKSALAGVLIVPYILWIGYALAINYGVVLLN